MNEINNSSDAMMECDRIEKEIEEKNKQIDTVQGQIADVKLKITVHKRDINNLEIEISGLRRSLEAAKHNKENLEMQYSSAKRKYFTYGKQGI